ncbi:MAG: carbohydrate ABC transporter substrate-binding protein [Treponema sp.]|nr:carbohydrate ABC transporter substrate-binding protein [Treponema sp.]
MKNNLNTKPRYALIINILLFLIVSLISCKKKNEESAFVPRLNTLTKCKIEVVGHYKNFEALEAEFDRFNEYYPNVELAFTYLDDYKHSVFTALSSNDPPDIFFTFPWMFDKSNYDPLFEKAENLADKNIEIDFSTISPKLLYHRSDGTVPTVPVLCTANGMLVNEDLFKKEKIEIPTNYNELIDACQKLKAAGYKSPILSHNSESAIMSSLIYPYFTKDVMNDKEAIAKLNELNPAAGEYMRPVLEWLEEFLKYGFIDIEECRKVKDNYSEMIMRFFEGDVPMLLASSDVASGTKKREPLSEAFTNKPFKYRFYAVPVMEDGGAVLEVPAIEFSVNKDGENIEMSNEFMRFLLRTEELNNLAKVKRLITCSTVFSLDDIFAPLGNAEHLYQLEIGIMDNTYTQLRFAGYKMFTGKMTLEEAIKNYGKF